MRITKECRPCKDRNTRAKTPNIRAGDYWMWIKLTGHICRVGGGGNDGTQKVLRIRVIEFATLDDFLGRAVLGKKSNSTFYPFLDGYERFLFLLLEVDVDVVPVFSWRF